MKLPFLSSPPLRVSVGRDTPELHMADASREGAFEELLLLEKHLSQEQCGECCNKHLSTAIAYLKEARTLQGGEQLDADMAQELASVRSVEWANAFSIVRPIRKRLAVRLGYAYDLGGPS